MNHSHKSKFKLQKVALAVLATTGMLAGSGVFAQAFDSNYTPEGSRVFSFGTSAAVNTGSANINQDEPIQFKFAPVNFCVFYKTKALAAANNGCVIDLTPNNAIVAPYAQDAYENNDADTSVIFFPNPGSFNISAIINKIAPDGTISASTNPFVFSANAEASANPLKAEQNNPVYTVLKDDVVVKFPSILRNLDTIHGDDWTDEDTDRPFNLCGNVGAPNVTEINMSGYDSWNPAVHCAVVFEKIPEGLVAQALTDTQLNTVPVWPNARNPIFFSAGTTFTGKLKNPTDNTFQYRIERWIHDGSTIQKLPRGTFTYAVTGVSAFDAGLNLTTTSTVVDGQAAASVTLSSTNPDLILIDNVSQAAAVHAAGKTPVLVTLSIAENMAQSQINTDGGVFVEAPLGLSDQGVYKVKYSASHVAQDGTLTLLESGFKPISNSAPMLTKLSAQNTYTVGTTVPDQVGFSASDADAGDSVTLSVEEQPANGTIALVDGKALYTPNANFFGSDTFSVRASDSFGAYEIRNASVTVLNGGPISASIVAAANTGYAPFATKLEMVLDNPEDAKNVRRIEWQQAAAGTTTWKILSGSATPTVTLREPGDLQVRAMIYSKINNAITTTEPVTLSATIAPLPNFIVNAKMDSGFSPAYLSLTLAPANRDEIKLMSGKKYTYSWDLPEGVTGTAKSSSAAVRIDTPGTYDFTAMVTDAYGNVATYEYTTTILEMKPFEFSMLLKPTSAFERSPMTYMVRPSLKLGHPKDRVSLYTLRVNNEVIGTPTSRVPSLVANLPAGTHNIELGFETKLGVSGSTSTQVTVAENVPPVCTLSALPVAKSSMVRIGANCKDTDGKLKGLSWTIDDVAQTRSSTAFALDMAGKTSSTVGVTAKDDSGATSTATITVNGPTSATGKF